MYARGGMCGMQTVAFAQGNHTTSGTMLFFLSQTLLTSLIITTAPDTGGGRPRFRAFLEMALPYCTVRTGSLSTRARLLSQRFVIPPGPPG